MSIFTEQYELLGSGTTFKEISASNFADFRLPHPSLTEQQAIADYLDEKCADIDSLIQTKQSKVDSLKEYKKSIIYEYVTGKREVNE
jgi:type I restriction enzyme S subunit